MPTATRNKPTYEYTFAVVYSDGESSKFYEIAANKRAAFAALWDELGDHHINDYVKSARIVDRQLVRTLKR